MTDDERRPLRAHEDAALFREAVGFTAARTGFSPRLVEKDYFCSVLLEWIGSAAAELAFRGGTCLAKVHMDFYRLSEDLDFLLPMPEQAARGERSRKVTALKSALGKLPVGLRGVRIASPLTGASESRQYLGVVEYDSSIQEEPGTIKVEIGLREPLLTPPVDGQARTLLLDPLRDSPLVSPFSVPCLSREEAMAEKFRAALTRREPAIRDYYDIDHAVHRMGFPLLDPTTIALLNRKLAVPGNASPDTSPARYKVIERQLDGQLRPVLRDRDLAEFDLARAFAAVSDVAEELG